MNQYAIKVENLSKQYKIGRIRRRENFTETLRADLRQAVNAVSRAVSQIAGNGDQQPADSDRHIWALRDINIEIQPGESVGIIGSNGAGKPPCSKFSCGSPCLPAVEPDYEGEWGRCLKSAEGSTQN